MALGYIALALIIVLLNIKELPGVLALLSATPSDGSRLWEGVSDGADAGHQTRAVQQRGRYGVRPQCGGNRTRQPPREARLDSDAGSIYRYADYMYLHRFHHSVQRCSTGWFHKRRTAYPACTDQRDRTFGSHLRCGSLVLLRISSILGNYYYGEANVRYLTHRKWVLNIYRILVGGMVMFGAVATFDLAWSLADVTMGLMVLCNLIAISLLGKYAFRLLEDYRAQKSAGIKDPVFTKNRLKEVEKDIECW